MAKLHDDAMSMSTFGVHRALASGVSWLLRSRNEHGWWQDFDIAGPSDEWVTGFVGAALSEVPSAAVDTAVAGAWRRLARRRWWSAGWGYNVFVPSDADSTVWALRLAQGAGVGRSLRVRRTLAFLARHQGPSGGIATFAERSAISKFIAVPSHIRLTGWSAEHVCVSAVAAAVLPDFYRQRILGFLRTRQRLDGSWTPYWWSDDEYATAVVVEALRMAPQSSDEVRIDAAAAWALGRLGQDGSVRTTLAPEGSPFATAFALRVLLAAEPSPQITAAVGSAIYWLSQSQRSDGRWPSSARMRVPPPNVIDPSTVAWGIGGTGAGSVGNVVVDQNGIFTTAAVVVALAKACGSAALLPSA